MKLLTLIIPTYNAEAFLEKGLESMILPDEWMERLEVLIVIDGSPDGSAAIGHRYEERYPQTFRVIEKENGGHGSGINVGAAEAKGTYFKVIDADDWVDTDCLVRTMQVLAETEHEPIDALVQSYRTIDISTTPETVKAYDVTYIDSEGDTVVDRLSKEDLEKNANTGLDLTESNSRTMIATALSLKVYNLRQLMDQPQAACHCMTFHGVLYNTAFYRSCNYAMPEKVFYEDQEYSTIPLCMAKRVGVLPEHLYEYRIGDMNQSVSAQSMVKKLDHFKTVESRMMAFEPRLAECPDGAYEFWLHKMRKFEMDIFRVMLLRSTDRKAYRKDAQELLASIRTKAPRLYALVKRKYRFMWWLNRLHVSDRTYEKMLKVR